MRIPVEEIQAIFEGLDAEQVRSVATAAHRRLANAVRLGVPEYELSLRRFLLEYADDARAGRPLEIGPSPNQELFEYRNFAAVCPTMGVTIK